MISTKKEAQKSAKKEELKKYQLELDEDEKIVKKISKIFKYKSLQKAKDEFNELYENKNQYRKKIVSYLKYYLNILMLD